MSASNRKAWSRAVLVAAVVALGVITVLLLREPTAQRPVNSVDPLDLPDGDGLFPAERKLALPAVRNPLPQPSDLDGTLILDWEIKTTTPTIHLGRDQSSMEELRSKLDSRLQRGNQPGVRRSGDAPERWYDGRRPTFAMAAAGDTPYEVVAQVLRVGKAAGLRGIWVKCKDEQSEAAAGKSLGFEWKWPERDSSVLKAPIVLDIDKNGLVSLNNQPKSAPGEMEDSLRLIREAGGEDPILVRPAAATPFKHVAPVWRMVVHFGLPMDDPGLHSPKPE